MNYTVEEAARLFDVGRNTVRNWIKSGLPTSDDKRPLLILGVDLRAFLDARRKRNKHSCAPGKFFCVGCRMPMVPAGNMADYIPSNDRGGALVGICPCCGSLMYRRVSMAKLTEVSSGLDVTMTQAHSHLGERS